MDEMREKVEGMQAQIEEADQMIRDLQGTICILEEEKERLKRELDALKLDAQFQYGKIAAYETVLKSVEERRLKVKLDPGAYLPTRAHATDAGLDLYSTEDKTVCPLKGEYDLGELTIRLSGGTTFDTGVHVELPHGYFGKIESKSGLNVKKSVVSCGGVIDEGYTGSIVVKLYNFGTSPYTVHKGDKIAQLVIMPYLAPELELVSALDDTDRGDNGFGSTGK